MFCNTLSDIKLGGRGEFYSRWFFSNGPIFVVGAQFNSGLLKQSTNRDIKRSYFRNFLIFLQTFLDSIIFSAARPASSEKRLRIPVWVCQRGASITTKGQFLLWFGQNKKLRQTKKKGQHKKITDLPLLLTDFFFTDFPDLWHPWLTLNRSHEV